MSRGRCTVSDRMVEILVKSSINQISSLIAHPSLPFHPNSIETTSTTEEIARFYQPESHHIIPNTYQKYCAIPKEMLTCLNDNKTTQPLRSSLELQQYTFASHRIQMYVNTHIQPTLGNITCQWSLNIRIKISIRL